MRLVGLQVGEEPSRAEPGTEQQKDPSGKRSRNLHAVGRPGRAGLNSRRSTSECVGGGRARCVATVDPQHRCKDSLHSRASGKVETVTKEENESLSIRLLPRSSRCHGSLGVTAGPAIFNAAPRRATIHQQRGNFIISYLLINRRHGVHLYHTCSAHTGRGGAARAITCICHTIRVVP